jgi:hypothetical protein
VVATAGTDWAALRNPEGPIPTEPKLADATQGASQNSVQVVQSNEVNEIDQAATNIRPASAWITYVLLIFGAILAAGAAIWFFRRPIPMYPRRVEDQ